jgi:hypothetical protein
MPLPNSYTFQPGALADYFEAILNAEPPARFDNPFLDRTQSKIVLAEAIKDAYSDLFAINKEAYKMTVDEVKNKFRTLYTGTKKEDTINRIASTFIALCEYADFTSVIKKNDTPNIPNLKLEEKQNVSDSQVLTSSSLNLKSLQYHINIVLPDSRDQAVYDAILKV